MAELLLACVWREMNEKPCAECALCSMCYFTVPLRHQIGQNVDGTAKIAVPPALHSIAGFWRCIPRLLVPQRKCFASVNELNQGEGDAVEKNRIQGARR